MTVARIFLNSPPISDKELYILLESKDGLGKYFRRGSPIQSIIEQAFTIEDEKGSESAKVKTNNDCQALLELAEMFRYENHFNEYAICLALVCREIKLASATIISQLTHDSILRALAALYSDGKLQDLPIPPTGIMLSAAIKMEQEKKPRQANPAPAAPAANSISITPAHNDKADSKAKPAYQALLNAIELDELNRQIGEIEQTLVAQRDLEPNSSRINEIAIALEKIRTHYSNIINLKPATPKTECIRIFNALTNIQSEAKALEQNFIASKKEFATRLNEHCDKMLLPVLKVERQLLHEEQAFIRQEEQAQQQDIDSLIREQATLQKARTPWWHYALAITGFVGGLFAIATGIGAVAGAALLAITLSKVAGFITLALGSSLSIATGTYTGYAARKDAHIEAASAENRDYSGPRPSTHSIHDLLLAPAPASPPATPVLKPVKKPAVNPLAAGSADEDDSSESKYGEVHADAHTPPSATDLSNAPVATGGRVSVTGFYGSNNNSATGNNSQSATPNGADSKHSHSATPTRTPSQSS